MLVLSGRNKRVVSMMPNMIHYVSEILNVSSIECRQANLVNGEEPNDTPNPAIS
ncbi:flagellar biosynthesis/type III secretory pathway chaperone [Paenibacillus aceris]|uniref:Flagellar biosynthesis/type III secretory pathway chaperone n=1 Tax=Paenibacillus aceris TaxID=869555 RepID=A0ABS4HSS3_9BACL|nr:flagellar biosynthesis/type III secretory pathway chaperone [Paenibacillus aceris]